MTASAPTPITVAQVDVFDQDRARQFFASLCTAPAWVEHMLDGRPYRSRSALHEAADRSFDALTKQDWLAAFAGHPQIGDRKALEQRFAGSGVHSEREQSGLDGVEAEVLTALAEGNERYQKRFGHVFLIRAAGRSAAEILEALRQRLDNDPDQELQIAADEQRAITHLRIDTLLAAERQHQ